MTAEPETLYGADDLTHLEGLDAVRKRPGMYIGSTDSRGVGHLVNEILDNSTDEGVAGHASTRRGDPARRRLGAGRRRRPGHPHRRARQVRHLRRRAGADPAARRRQVRRLRLQDLRRPARRRRLGGQRAVPPLRRDRPPRPARSTRCRSGTASRASSTAPGPDAPFTAGPGLQVVGAMKRGQRTGTSIRYWHDARYFETGAALDVDAVRTKLRNTAFLVPGVTYLLRDADRRGARRGAVPLPQRAHRHGGVPRPGRRPAGLRHPAGHRRGHLQGERRRRQRRHAVQRAAARRGRGGVPLGHRLRAHRRVLHQHHPQRARRHPPQGLRAGPRPRPRRRDPQHPRPAQAQGGPADPGRRPGGHDRGGARADPRAAVHLADQGRAVHRRHHQGAPGAGRAAHQGVAGGPAHQGRGAHRPAEDRRRRPGAAHPEAAEGRRPAQDRPGGRVDAAEAGRLPGHRHRPQRAVHRRG